MSEAKRVPLQTLEFPESLGHAAKKEKKGEKGKELAPSFRFTLALHESNEKACPEFNYAQLLKAAEKKRRKELKRSDENATNGLDPFDDDDEEDKLRDMARRFEAKYGTATMGRKRHNKFDDYVDLGAGYDENDSFIDNTDAYDEIVPEEMTTAHGGFYINCGALEFKASDSHSLVHNNNNNNNNNNNDEDDSSESSEEDTEGVESPKRGEKRNMISSSDEDETEDITGDQPRKKPKVEENGEKKSNHENPLKKKKKHQTPQQPQEAQQQNSQEADILQRRKEKGETTDAEGSEDQEEKKKIEKTDSQKSKSIVDKKFEKKASNSNGFDTKKLDLKKLGGKDSNIDDAIESVVNAARVDDESSRDTTDSGKSRGILGTESECDDIDKEEAPLPEALPEEIKEIVNKIKMHAENSKEGKNKFFNSSVNSALFSLEKKLRMLNTPSVRLQTYGHLARFLPCSKITLLNRAKKLYLEDAEYKFKEPMYRLEAIISNVMPAVLDKFARECQKVAYEKGPEGSPADAESSDDDDSSSKTSESSKIPKKRFPWTEEAKKLVYEIANARRHYFKILRPRKESMESFVATFMKSKVLPMWPQGAVRLQTLLKYASLVEPVMKKKSKKPKDGGNVNCLTSSGSNVCNSRVETSNTNSVTTQEREKTPTMPTKILSCSESANNFVNQATIKSNESNGDKKQQTSKHKDKNKDPSVASQQPENSTINNTTVGKISVVPTAQLMAQKPAKSHVEKFNLIDLTNSSLSITPVSDYHKSTTKTSEIKKDVVSITPYSEPSGILSNTNEVSQSSLSSVHRQDSSYTSTSSHQQHSNYAMPNQQTSHVKPVPLKHRLLQENADGKVEKSLDDKDVDISAKADKRDKRRERCVENKQKPTDSKKRKKDHKVIDQIGPINPEIVPMQQQAPLSKEEQEQRQIEETVAATNFLSQIINDDVTVRSMSDKRKDNSLGIDETLGNLVQPTEQEKDVQMVMRSLKELQELQEMKCSPSHSPVGGGMQKPSKSGSQYVTYQEDYQRLYLKKDDKLRSKEEAQW